MARTKRKSPQSTEIVRRLTLKAKTPNQKTYLEKIKTNDVILCNGMAGTGKSHCAVGSAVLALDNKEISNIIVAKPLIEAEKSIGAMPGEIGEKVFWYFNSLSEIFLNFMDKKRLNILIENKTIQFLPISFWRGYTFGKSYIIVDEAQNLTMTQLKLVFTRIGPESKLILCGDTQQSDLGISPSGFQICINKLVGINRLDKMQLEKKDVVRHGIISDITKEP